MREFRFREPVEAQSGDEIEFLVRVPVELGEGICRMLGMAAVALKLVRHQVIAHIVAAGGQDVLACEGVVVKCADGMLYVAVIAHVTVTGHEVVALVVLVERVRKFQIVLICDGVVSFQSTREAAVAVFEALRGVALAEEIACPRRKSQSFRNGEYQTLLDIERGVAVDGAVIADMRVVRAFRKVDGVD